MKKNSIFSKLAAVSATAAMVGTMGVCSAFAATHDGIEDISSSTATVNLGKVLTTNHDNKFPNITDFNFEIERIEAWDNANVSTAQNGAAIAKADIPMPTVSNTANHTVTVSGDKASVAVGNFKSTPSEQTGVADTATSKLRTTAVNITYNKAGYYVYKVKEVSSTPASAPGVEYDDHEYFIVVYVCNNTDASGNTTSGVYVHNITSYRNESGSETYKPNLTEIATTQDNGGTAATTNDRDNLAKVGISSSTTGTDATTGLAKGPNKLEAYKFWNDQFVQDLVITKNVTGSLGDKTKEFEFTVTLTGLEPGVTYTSNVAAADTGDTTTSGAKLVSATVGTVDSSAKSITASNNGTATFLIKLKDDDKFVINALPVGATYAVSEASSDHVASYAVTASGGQEATIAKASDANSASYTALATDTETVNKLDGTATVAYTNDKNILTPTGLSSNMILFATAGIVVVAAAAVYMNRRKEYDVSIEEM